MDVLTATAAIRPANEGRRPSLSVVVPVYDEEAVLPEFHQRLAAALDAVPADVEIVYVNDGSRDGSMAVLVALHGGDARVSVVDLSRNFGKEVAMSAGLDHAGGDAVVVIDADLQDPPELIPEMMAAWQEGYDVVLMRRAHRADESWLKKATARAFYRAIGSIGTIDIPANVGDFRLLSRRAVDALTRFPERSRFMKGLFAWIGFPCKEITYDRDGRYAGRTKWNYWRLWNFALEGITSFSVVPLKVASYVGFADRARCLCVRRVRDRQDAALRRAGSRLPDAGRPGAFPGRAPVDGAGDHRRIPGPDVHRGQATPALSRRPEARAGATAPLGG